jgi:hypothetical protein
MICQQTMQFYQFKSNDGEGEMETESERERERERNCVDNIDLIVRTAKRVCRAMPDVSVDEGCALPVWHVSMAFALFVLIEYVVLIVIVLLLLWLL